MEFDLRCCSQSCSEVTFGVGLHLMTFITPINLLVLNPVSSHRDQKKFFFFQSHLFECPLVEFAKPVRESCPGPEFKALFSFQSLCLDEALVAVVVIPTPCLDSSAVKTSFEGVQGRSR